MYVTGTPHTLERRLHQFATDATDYTAYQTEAASISGQLSDTDTAKLSRELEKKAVTLHIE